MRNFDLQEPEIDAFSKEGKRLSELKGEINFKNIHFAYPTRPEIKVVDGISFKVMSSNCHLEFIN